MERLDSKRIENILPLTILQEGMLFHHLKESRSDIYFEQLSLQIGGEIDRLVFEKAWNVVIQANEMLRTVFRWEKLGKPSQVILKEHACEIRFHDFSNISNIDVNQKKTALAKIKTNDRVEGFDLTHVPFRVILCRLDETLYEMIISNHHILYDGWSIGIVLKEFFNAYHGLAHDRQVLNLPLKPSFKEYVKWIQSQGKNNQEQFWRDYLDGFELPMELPIKMKIKEAKGAEDHSIILEKDIKNKLDIFVKNNRVTLASIFYSAWGVLLQRYCDSEDVIFGTTISGRSCGIEGIDNMVGLFINTIPLRIQITSNEKIINAVIKNDQSLREREAFGSTPLVDIGNYSPMESGQSLFDTILVIENYPLDDFVNLSPENNSISIHSYSMIETTHYDLSVSIIPLKEIEIKFSFKRELFVKESIENLAGHFKGIIKNMIENPEKPLSQLEIISIEEKSRILYDFNNTTAEYPRDKSIHQLFEEQSARIPDRIVLIGVDKEKKIENGHLSYRELSARTDKLAEALIEKGVLPDTIVGIMMERSIEIIIGILGILKSGGAYMPIDPEYPQERINYMLKDSSAKILMNKSEARISKYETNPNVQKINDQNKNIEDLTVLNLDHLDFGFISNFGFRISNFNSSNLAYIIYTSGSTGKPKGVMIEHAAVHNFIEGMMQCIDFKPGKKILALTTISFDIFGLEFFMPICKGLEIVLADEEQQREIHLLKQLILKGGVDMIQATPARMQMLLLNEDENSCLRNLKEIMVGGEVFPVKLNSDLAGLTAANIYNMYGPTETTIWSTVKKLSGTGNITIGKPIINTQVYILNKDLKMQPVGIPGEMYIGGDGVARGYLNHPELTAERFIDFHHSSFDIPLVPRIHHSKFYCTGDLARWLADGNIEFLGRQDQQVKIRGFRIELSEIENLLLKHDRIKDTVVILKEDESGDKSLMAYFVSDIELLDTELREYLLKDLPDYMNPSYFVRLEKIPLTPSGKVDRKALPEPKLKREETYVAPRNDIENKLVEIWGNVLGKNISLNPIGIDDHFFRLGGHSLKATSLVSFIHKTLNVKIPLEEIFKRPTIRKLSEYINEAVKDQCVLIEPIEEDKYAAIEPTEKKEYYEASFGQKRVWILSQSPESSLSFNMFGTHSFNEKLNIDFLSKVFSSLIERHESLRTVFYLLNEDIRQKVLSTDKINFHIDFKDFREIEDKEKVLSNLLESEKNTPFDLERGPLLRAKVIQIEAARYLLLFSMHHIVSDFLSMAILYKEFLQLYEFLKTGKKNSLNSLKIQYKDYVYWQKKQLDNRNFEKLREYWLNRFNDEIPILELPYDKERPKVQSYNGERIAFYISEDFTDKIRIIAKENDATLFIMLLASINVLLFFYSGQNDITLGIPASCREHPDLENQIGFYLNTLALRIKFNQEESFLELLKIAKVVAVKAYDHQMYPFDKLIDELKIKREPNKHPLFDVMVDMLNLNQWLKPFDDLLQQPVEAYEDEGLINIYKGKCKFDFTVYFSEGVETINVIFEYNKDLFERETVVRMAKRYKKLLEYIIKNPIDSISKLIMLEEVNVSTFDFFAGRDKRYET